jgi:hypothetical protein
MVLNGPLMGLPPAELRPARPTNAKLNTRAGLSGLELRAHGRRPAIVALAASARQYALWLQAEPIWKDFQMRLRSAGSGAESRPRCAMLAA